eukprot:scaffold8733_cov114-Isochrysis_galbana.AAC.10
MISCVVMLSASMRVTVRSPVSMASLLLSINSVVRAVSIGLGAQWPQSQQGAKGRVWRYIQP